MSRAKKLATNAANDARSNYLQRAVDRVTAFDEQPRPTLCGGFDADRGMAITQSLGNAPVANAKPISNGGMAIGQSVDAAGGYVDAMPRTATTTDEPQTGRSTLNPVFLWGVLSDRAPDGSIFLSRSIQIWLKVGNRSAQKIFENQPGRIASFESGSTLLTLINQQLKVVQILRIIPDEYGVGGELITQTPGLELTTLLINGDQITARDDQFLSPILPVTIAYPNEFNAYSQYLAPAIRQDQRLDLPTIYNNTGYSTTTNPKQGKLQQLVSRDFPQFGKTAITPLHPFLGSRFQLVDGDRLIANPDAPLRSIGLGRRIEATPEEIGIPSDSRLFVPGTTNINAGQTLAQLIAAGDLGDYNNPVLLSAPNSYVVGTQLYLVAAKGIL